MNDIRKSLKIIRENERIDELKPMSRLGKMATNIGAKFGSSKAQMTQTARDAATGVWKDWVSARKRADIKPTPENLTKWLTRRKIDSDIIDAAFKGIGIDNVSQGETSDIIDEPSDEISNTDSDEETPIEERMPKEGDSFKDRGGDTWKFNGKGWRTLNPKTNKWVKTGTKNPKITAQWREAIKDNGEESTDTKAGEKMPKQGDSFEVPIKDSDPMKLEYDGEKWNFIDDGGNLRPAKDDMQDNLTKSWRQKSGGETPKPTGEKLSDKVENPAEAPANVVADHIEQEKGASEEQTAEIFRTAGVDSNSDEPIGQEALDQITKATNDAEEAGEFADEGSDEESVHTMDSIKDIMGKYYRPAVNQAIEVMNSGDYSKLTNLQKWGFAVLAAENSKIKIK